MVVFTCNYCGDSLQKPRVEKHCNTVCRKPKNLTCVDCLKDFRDEEYVVHTKCFTEDERYAAKGSMPNGVVKKGEAKQESWMNMITSIIAAETGASDGVKNLLNVISAHTNVPRKKQKFMNFVKCTTGGRVNLRDVEAVWNIIEKHKDATNPQKNDTTNNKPAEENGTKSARNGSAENAESNGKGEDNENTGENKKSKKKSKTKRTDEDEPATKKSKQEVEVEEPQGVAMDDANKFDFQTKIVDLLKSVSDKTMSLSKLQKKVLKAHRKSKSSESLENYDLAKATKKFNKQLTKIKGAEIVDDIVTLK